MRSMRQEDRRIFFRKNYRHVYQRQERQETPRVFRVPEESRQQRRDTEEVVEEYAPIAQSLVRLPRKHSRKQEVASSNLARGFIMVKSGIFNPANAVTFVRLIVGIFIFYYIFTENYSICLVLLILFAFLDFLDGFIARRFECNTLFGKNFDILVDGLGLLLYLLLYLKGFIPNWYLLLAIPPTIIYLSSFVRSVIKCRNTFMNAEWKNLEGVFYFGGLIMFLIQHPIAVIIAYLMLVGFYFFSIKYFLEIQKFTAA